MSIFIVTDTELISPAPFVAVQMTVVPAVSVVNDMGSQPDVASTATPDVGSVVVQLKPTFVLFQPAPFGDGEIVGVTMGAVRSILTTTETDLLKPALFVAEHVSVTPLVSADNVVLPQPELLLIPDSGSVTLQLTVTGTVVFQPKPFGAGFTVGTMTGGVVSPAALVTVSCVGKPRETRSEVARVTVFPDASDRNTLVTVQVPFSLPFGNVTATVPVVDVLAVKLAAAVCVVKPEGPVKTAWNVVAPDRSSVT